MTSSSRPPYSSGIREPNRPNAFICSTIASGYVSECSSSDACGMTSLRTHSRTVPTSSSANSGSVTVLSKLRQRIGHKGLESGHAVWAGERARPAVTGVDDVPHRIDDHVWTSRVGTRGLDAHLGREVHARPRRVDRLRTGARLHPVDDPGHSAVAPHDVAGVMIAV